MQFSGNFKGKTLILSKFWAQGPLLGVKLRWPPDQNPGSAPAVSLSGISQHRFVCCKLFQRQVWLTMFGVIVLSSIFLSITFLTNGLQRHSITEKKLKYLETNSQRVEPPKTGQTPERREVEREFRLREHGFFTWLQSFSLCAASTFLNSKSWGMTLRKGPEEYHLARTGPSMPVWRLQFAPSWVDPGGLSNNATPAKVQLCLHGWLGMRKNAKSATTCFHFVTQTREKHHAHKNEFWQGRPSILIF